MMSAVDRSLTTTEAERQKFARDACMAYLGSISMFVVYEANRSLGSGIVFNSRSGDPLLLTARHVAERLRETFLIRRATTNEAVQVRAHSVVLGPERPSRYSGVPGDPFLDVAVVRFDSDVTPVLPANRCEIDTVAVDDDVRADDVIVLTGYPAFLTFTPAGAAGTLAVSNICYTTGVVGRDDHGRLEVEWNEAVAHPNSPRFPHFDMSTTTPTKLGTPHGISGGGLWRIRGPISKEAIWSPTRFASLIGVASAWDTHNREFVEPVSLWREWFAFL